MNITKIKHIEIQSVIDGANKVRIPKNKPKCTSEHPKPNSLAHYHPLELLGRELLYTRGDLKCYKVVYQCPNCDMIYIKKDIIDNGPKKADSSNSLS